MWTSYAKGLQVMHLADAFIQSDSQGVHSSHCQVVCSLGINPKTLALLAPCSNSYSATGTSTPEKGDS